MSYRDCYLWEPKMGEQWCKNCGVVDGAVKGAFMTSGCRCEQCGAVVQDEIPAPVIALQAKVTELESQVAKHDCIILNYNATLANRDMRIVQLEAAARWIAVEERLPEDMEVVMWCRADDGCISMGEFSQGYWDRCKVTHWMPLPQPPSKGE